MFCVLCACVYSSVVLVQMNTWLLRCDFTQDLDAYLKPEYGIFMLFEARLMVKKHKYIHT